ncbi:MAG: flagellar biosynthetic protein FliQ [Bacillota bacterium]|nr:MAG: flagellar biosynthetic protein FliQ [Bacillota bacterium]MBS3951256.1 flagellar biosynthesis protein FliQ [Peptococcaceae bacterium]
MTEGSVIHLARETISLVLLLAGPLLLVSLAVGLAVSIFQAATQIQEQTLTFVPKLVAILITLLVLGGWMMNTMLSFTVNHLSNLGRYVR